MIMCSVLVLGKVLLGRRMSFRSFLFSRRDRREDRKSFNVCISWVSIRVRKVNIYSIKLI